MTPGLLIRTTLFKVLVPISSAWHPHDDTGHSIRLSFPFQLNQLWRLRTTLWQDYAQKYLLPPQICILFALCRAISGPASFSPSVRAGLCPSVRKTETESVVLGRLSLDAFDRPVTIGCTVEPAVRIAPLILAWRSSALRFLRRCGTSGHSMILRRLRCLRAGGRPKGLHRRRPRGQIP